MFEFGRGLRRLFDVRGRSGGSGPAGGDGALYDRLDLKTLKAEAMSLDAVAGRAGGREGGRRRLAAAAVWREVARRSGDADALRRASAAAESAAGAFAGGRRRQYWARARLEQASCALVGLELFGDSALEPAAEAAAAEAQCADGAVGMIALARLAQVGARKALVAGGLTEARAAARAFGDPIALMEAAGRRDRRMQLAAAETRLARSELLQGIGLRLRGRGSAPGWA